MMVFVRLGLAAAAALAAAGCDQLALGPPKAASAPAETAAPSDEAPVSTLLRGRAGETYSAFVASTVAYDPEGLGLNAADRARLWRAMATHATGELVTGGGAEALVFRGCADEACEGGAAVVAIDTTTGAAFAGVRDTGGTDVLAPNDRVEALLRLNSPTRSWANPAPAAAPAP